MDDTKVIQKLLDHDQKFEQLSTEIRDFRNGALTAQDKMLKILQRLDQERVFANNWVQPGICIRNRDKLVILTK